MQNLPFFWPTKTLILDDNKLFLEGLKEMLDNDDSYIFFSDPKEALNYLADYTVQLDWYINTPISLEQGVAQYNINYDLIQSIVSNEKRFNLVSNVIVDYHMPSMSGIDFCKLVAKDKFLRKTLLTANMDYSQAIKNLNDQTINGFIDKKDISKNGLLKKHVGIEKITYFSQRANFIIEALAFENQSIAVLSVEYNKIINQIIHDLNIKEYYLLSQSGLYLMIDEDCMEYYIFLFSQEDIQEMALEAQDQGLESNICLSLETQEKAVCYYNRDNSSSWPECSKWGEYLAPLKKFLVADRDYYYAIINKQLKKN